MLGQVQRRAERLQHLNIPSLKFAPQPIDDMSRNGTRKHSGTGKSSLRPGPVWCVLVVCLYCFGVEGVFILHLFLGTEKKEKISYLLLPPKAGVGEEGG